MNDLARARQHPKQMEHKHQQRQNQKLASWLRVTKAALPSRAWAASVVSSRSKIAQVSARPSKQSIFPFSTSSGIPEGNSTLANWSVR